MVVCSTELHATVNCDRAGVVVAVSDGKLRRMNAQRSWQSVKCMEIAHRELGGWGAAGGKGLGRVHCRMEHSLHDCTDAQLHAATNYFWSSWLSFAYFESLKAHRITWPGGFKSQ